MKKFTSLLFASILCATGCAGSQNEIQTASFAANIQQSPEMLELDAHLDQLDEDTARLSAEYEELQARILPHTSFETDDVSKADKLVIVINENNVLSVNGKTMSKNDFAAFADKALPSLCSPAPVLSIHKKADYDSAAWILDSIYSHGCADVKIE